MRRQSLGQTTAFAALLTAGWGVVLLVTQDDTEPRELALSLPLFFVVIFGTMRLSNRVAARLFQPKPGPPRPPPTAPSSERPDHAQRRRGRARRRHRG